MIRLFCFVLAVLASPIERAFETFAREPNGGVIAFQDNLTVVNGELMVLLSNRHQLPFVTPI